MADFDTGNPLTNLDIEFAEVDAEAGPGYFETSLEPTAAQVTALQQQTYKALVNAELAAADDHANQYLHNIDRFIGDGTYTDIVFRGSTMSRDLASLCDDVSFSAGYDQITQLTMTFEDPALKLLGQGFFQIDGQVSYRLQSLEITASNSGAGSSGMGGATITCRPAIIGKLKRAVGTFVQQNISKSEFVKLLCKQVGCAYVVQDSPTIWPNVARDVIDPTAVSTTSRDELPSSWTTLQRLAQEEGYAVFEWQNVVYFGQPSWLLARKGSYDHTVWWNTPGISDYHSARALPDMSVSNDQGPQAVVTVTVDVPLERAHEFSIADSLILQGVPYYNEARDNFGRDEHTAAKYLITSIQFDLGMAGKATITAQTPVDPQPTVVPTAAVLPSSVTDPGLATGNSATAILPSGSYGGQTYNSKQLANVANVYRAGSDMGVDEKGIISAFETCIVESHFRNLANSNNAQSLSLPHDGTGSDHTSIGCFQQQDSWGSVAQRLDSYQSAKLYYSRYNNLPTTYKFYGTAGQIAQKIQVSAYPDRYDAQAGSATALYHAQQAKVQEIETYAADTAAAAGSAALNALGNPQDKRASSMVRVALKQKGRPYSVVFPNSLAGQLSEFDCSLLVQWASYQVGVKNYPRDTYHQVPWIEQHNLIIPVNQAIATRGAVFFMVGSDGHHTAISLGNGMTIEAANHIEGVISTHATGRGWSTAGLIPGMRYP